MSEPIILPNDDQRRSSQDRLSSESFNSSSIFAPKVFELAQSGLDFGDDTVGFHGTSIEGLKCLVMHGFIPGSVFRQRGHPVDFLCFLPRAAQFSAHQDHYQSYLSEEQSLNEAKLYSAQFSRSDFFIAELGLDPDDFRTQCDAAQFLSDLEMDRVSSLELLESIMTNVKNISTLYDAGEKALAYSGGLVIGLSSRAISELKIYPGDENEFRLLAPDGLPLEFITGIYVYGEREAQFIASLARDLI